MAHELSTEEKDVLAKAAKIHLEKIKQLLIQKGLSEKDADEISHEIVPTGYCVLYLGYQPG